jgi:hypothetical protein
LEGVAEKVRRVVSGYYRNPLKLMNAVAKFGDRLLGGKQKLGRKASEGQDCLRTYGLKLTPEERAAPFNLIWLRITVSRWPTLDHVANVNLIAPPAHSSDDAVKQLAGGTHKGSALAVFFLTWTLANQSHPG